MKKIYRTAGIFLALTLLGLKIHAQDKRPNIVLIMADDMGYSDLGCYGGEVQTPNIDGLAKEGIRYRQFYNAARCCPTRASLMTGLYPHQAGMGWMAAADLGTPEYQGNLNNTSVTIAEVLKSAGYSTYMTGKWHLTNERKIKGEVKDNWPKQRGFDRYFGIIPGGANYFTPTVYSNNKSYKAPKDFYLTNAISDTSVAYIKDHVATEKDKPFFMYVAYTSPHWPLHALQKDIAKYKDIYQVGWDSIRKARFARQKELGLFPEDALMTPRDPEIPAWKDEPQKLKKEMAMRMAIYAAQIDIMDQGVGRIITELKNAGELDNTLIFFLSDNGACAEYISSGKSKKIDGTADTFESYRINWANVSSTPFKEYKHYTYEGGIATPFIVHWPNGVKSDLNGSFTGNYGQIMDVMATCVDVANATYPKEFNGNQITPMQGKSLTPNFKGKVLDRGEIFWEHEANIALRDGKWKMVAKTKPKHKFSKSSLRLYDLQSDPTEMNDLSAEYPEKLESMYENWHSWGESIHVFPMNTRMYNDRMQTYRRNINGEFEDNLGDWHIKKANAIKAEIVTDHASELSGRNSARISMEDSRGKESDLVMNWKFPARKGEKLRISLKNKSNRESSFILRLEKLHEGESSLMDEQILVKPEEASESYTSVKIPEDGNYKLALYFGALKPGDRVWVDDIEINSIEN